MSAFKSAYTSAKYHVITAPFIHQMRKVRDNIVERYKDRIGGATRSVQKKTRGKLFYNPRAYTKGTLAGQKRRLDLAKKLKAQRAGVGRADSIVKNVQSSTRKIDRFSKAHKSGRTNRAKAAAQAFHARATGPKVKRGSNRGKHSSKPPFIWTSSVTTNKPASSTKSSTKATRASRKPSNASKSGKPRTTTNSPKAATRSARASNRTSTVTKKTKAPINMTNFYHKHQRLGRVGKIENAIKSSKTHGELKRRLRVQATKLATASTTGLPMGATRKDMAKKIKEGRKKYGRNFEKGRIKGIHSMRMHLAAAKIAKSKSL